MRFDSVKVILFMLVILLVLSGTACASEQSAGGAAAVRAEFSKLPLSFIPNQGQADPAVLYQAKAEGHTIFFTNNDVVLVADNDGAPAVFSTTVAGANPAATVVGVDPLPGTASFFIGNDPANWQSGLATYGGVEYKNVLPGVDLTYRGTNGVLKREFVVAPGADASGIVIVYDNIDGLAYGPDGTLEVQTPSGVLTETAPVCYQVINGVAVNVPARYNILGNGKAGFNFGAYDTTYPLVIDPALLYSSYLGGSVNDAAYGIDVDSLGQAYVTGYTASTNFPVNHSFNVTSNGCSDVFVTKVSANGKYLLYSTYLGGNNSDAGNGIAVNSTGWAFVTGYTTSLNFPVDPTGTPKNSNSTTPYPCPFPGCLGQADAFISAIPPDGLSLPYSTCIGGNLTDVGTSIAIDKSPNNLRYVYVTGYTNSPDFPLNNPVPLGLLNQGAPTSASDAFIVYYEMGTALPAFYSSFWGGSDNDQGTGIATIDVNTFYVTGWTQSTNFTTTPAAYWTANSGGKDGFVSKFSWVTAPTPTIAYSTYLGGESNDECRGIAVANVGGSEYAHVTGVTYSNTFPIQNPFEPFDEPNFGTSQFGDAFITKLEPDGQLNWSTYMGGTNNDGGNSIALDSLRNIYITGYTSSSDFPIVNPVPGFGVKHPFQDAFITEINSNLTNINMSTFLGGNLDDTGTGIAVSDANNIFITGFTTSYDFPTSTNYPGVNSFKVTNKYNGNHYSGWVEGFVTHINNVPTPASPVANFTYSIPSPWGCLPIPVTFTDTSTGGPTSWQWNFGDGTANSTAPNPVHSYSNGGTFTVTLTISNTLGTSSTSQVIYVPTSASPKFTMLNSTTGINDIHIPQNGTGRVSLYLAATPQGLSGYNLTLSFRNTTPPLPWVPNTTVANITNVSRPEWIPQNVDIFQVSNVLYPLGDGYNVTFQGADINLAILPGALDVRLANITIHGNQIGNSTLHINSTNMMTDDAGHNITLCPPDTNLTVYVERLQPLPGSIVPPAPFIPTDPNGDGLYEDVNGDHIYNYYDVIDFFTYLWWVTNNYGPITDDTNEYQPFFDFDHNGVVNYMDVITLYYNIPLLI